MISISIKLSRKLWNYIYWKVFTPPLNYWFRVILRSHDIKFGKNIKTIRGLPRIKITNGEASIGNDVTFNNYGETSWYCRCDLMVFNDGTLNIGDGVGMNGCSIICQDSIRIGKHVMIGGGTRIYDSNFHPLDWQERRNPSTKSKGKTAAVIIEDDVFIGTNCIIQKGVTIGARSIIAAGSVVVKDIPDDTIAGGNPCKIIKRIVHE